jgi:DNA mismatch repair protein MutS
MYQTAVPLAKELAKEIRSLRARLGAKQLIDLPPGGEAESDLQAPADHGSATEASNGEMSPTNSNASPFSLLWPSGSRPAACFLDQSSQVDLGMEQITTALAQSTQREQVQSIQDILLQMCTDPTVIRYRQDVMADLLRNPQLLAGLEELLPQIEKLGFYSRPPREMIELYQVTWWLGELESYVECVQAAGRAFERVEGEISSDGLRDLRARVASTQQDPVFQQLVRELPALLARMRGVLSVTIGVNLDPDLRPVAATLISVNDQRFVEAPLLRALFGKAAEHESVMPLHTLSEASGSGPNPLGSSRPNPILVPLFRDLARILEQVSKPIAQALQNYIHLSRRFLDTLAGELFFYLGAVKMIQRVEAGGLPMCRPELAPQGERLCEVKEIFNLNLALHLLDRAGISDLRQAIVTNEVALNHKGRIVILTGPNQGGKTTYTQAIGIAQVLAQVGLYVPGIEARISPVDNVYTHFPREEELQRGTGRFGDEARRLREVFARASRHSLVLLNETLSGTYAGESLYLARDMMRAWRLLGARVVFVTHLHELAAQADELNAETAGDSPIVSMVSSIPDPETMAAGSDEVAIKRTYRVVQAPPMGRSYALELAKLYGISFEQLVDLLHERQVLVPQRVAQTDEERRDEWVEEEHNAT